MSELTTCGKTNNYDQVSLNRMKGINRQTGLPSATFKTDPDIKGVKDIFKPYLNFGVNVGISRSGLVVRNRLRS